MKETKVESRETVGGATATTTALRNGAIPFMEVATEENFSEIPYLAANPDISKAVEASIYKTGRDHWERFGRGELRKMIAQPEKVLAARTIKVARIRSAGLVDTALEREPMVSVPINCLSDELVALAGIEPTDLVSSHDYPPRMQTIVDENPDAWILDAGSGLRPTYYRNVVNFEIVPYPTTDVLGIAERLPFVDGSFDYVYSASVLEHVRDPFAAAREIVRVLKPGGELICSVPFLQPYHGYPHHYFNMTRDGLASLFTPALRTIDHTVPPYLHPIWTLTWLVSSWAAGLERPARKEFLQLRLKDLRLPFSFENQSYLTGLSTDKMFELACGTMLHARKE